MTLRALRSSWDTFGGSASRASLPAPRRPSRLRFGDHDVRDNHDSKGDHSAAPRGRPGAGEQTMSNEKQKPTEVSRRQFVGTVATTAGVTIVPRHVLGAGSRRRATRSTWRRRLRERRHGHEQPAQRGEDRQHRRAVRLRRARRPRPAEQRGTTRQVPEGDRLQDFRVMLEKQKDIDAVLVATPDHARRDRHGRDAARQARLRAEAADAHGQRGGR